MRRTRRPRFVLMNKMDDLNLHYRFLNWRRRIREIREVRAFRYQERFKHILVDGDTLSYHGNSGEVGCYVASRPLTKDSNYFEVSIVDSGVRGTIAVGLVPQYYSLDHQPGWLPDSVAYHADDGKLYNGRAKGRQFGSKCNSGDRIGCGIEPVSFDVQTAQIFFTKNGKRVGSTIMPMSPDGLFPAVGMHSLGEEVRLHLNAELGREDDSVMMVDSYEDEWGRLHDVRVCGTLLEYLGKGKSIVDVGLAQARHPLSTRSHYFEVEIVDPGEKCYIALGLARKDYPKNRHPGWSRGSVAYHADDGKIFHGSGVGDPFGPRCYKGDIMGCGIMFPRDYILDSEGFLHSEWQDHWEEGCCRTFWGLLPHNWDAELWGESQSGSAPLEWLGLLPWTCPFSLSSPFAEPGTSFLTPRGFAYPAGPRGCVVPLSYQIGPLPSSSVPVFLTWCCPCCESLGESSWLDRNQPKGWCCFVGGSHWLWPWAPACPSHSGPCEGRGVSACLSCCWA
ncbi:SPRY domain-containing protein 3 isoform X1 [Physeter macrocephalus]|uniref:SPRY domain-containing protein 3 isoform X1 n=1 Tax=Physeter macrocephalus TaxID=9755 RepID=A0A9W2WQX2_PHYMC|nr:SPRY domain-containing protein 3 isoform X1 [Physeter catodon]